MKANRFLFIVFVLVSSISADTIYLRNGQEVKDAVVTKVGDSDVEYKIGQRETIYTAKKTGIMMILYNDGTKDIFNSEPARNGKFKEEIQGEKEGIRFGVKGGVALVGISGSDNFVGVDNYDYGFGGGLGVFVSIPISSFYFVPELFVQYRKLGELSARDTPCFMCVDPYERERIRTIDVTYEEIGIDIPLVFRFLLSEDRKLYLEAGPQIGFVIGKSRIIEYGLVLGTGYKITDNWGVDLHGYYSLTNYYDTYTYGQGCMGPGGDGSCMYEGTNYIVDGHIYYAQIGVSYTF